eukprot:TRINITY_DN74693_c0_g1_i1.p2 TRINITY_DN74693_c0_g1~~TRINITY_DN74693_c0_g1_i1.p2  ORF type:complete len:267 (+),score=57.68 TRINITY_DN74693_c0_g1_i1:78-878(+)
MALQHYDGGSRSQHRSSGSGGSGRGGHGAGPAAQQHPMDMMMPFGGGFGGGLFGGRDPFKEFGADPFGGPGFGGGFGGIGGMMKQFDEMARDMRTGSMPPSARQMGGGAPGGGQYACQTFSMSSVRGADGKMHTEQYMSSDVGNRDHGIRERQDAYSNSTTGVDKMGLERQLGDRGRKVVKERDRRTQEERQTEMFRGMDEGGKGAFDRDFSGKAHHMPQHARYGGGVAAALGGGSPAGHGGRNGYALADGHSSRSRSQPNHMRRR